MICVWMLALSVDVVVRNWFLGVELANVGFECDVCSLLGEGSMLHLKVGVGSECCVDVEFEVGSCVNVDFVCLLFGYECEVSFVVVVYTVCMVNCGVLFCMWSRRVLVLSVRYVISWGRGSIFV